MKEKAKNAKRINAEKELVQIVLKKASISSIKPLPHSKYHKN